jgi:hypothetical protein
MAMEATSFERNSMEERGGDDGLETDPSNSSSRAPGACVCAWSRLSDHRLTVSTQSPVLLFYFRTTSKCSTASLLLFHRELRLFVLGPSFHWSLLAAVARVGFLVERCRNNPRVQVATHSASTCDYRASCSTGCAGVAMKS